MPATGQSDNAITFSFDGPARSSVDLNAIQAAIEQEAAASEPTALTVDNSQAAKEPAATQEQPTDSKDATQDSAQDTAAKAEEKAVEAVLQPAAKEASPEELKTYELEVNGEKIIATEADLKAGHMRHRDYTQKTQALAAERQRIEQERIAWEAEKSQYRNEFGAIDQFLRDEAAIAAYMEKAFGRSMRAAQPMSMPQIDPNKPPTVEEVAEIARYNAEQVRLANQREIAQLKAEQQAALLRAQQAADHAAATKMAGEVEAHIASLVTQFPALKDFENINEDLMADAARYKPKSLDEAKVRLREAAERRVAVLQTHATKLQKQAAVQAATVKKQSPEPTGGTAPRQAQAKPLTLNTSDRKALLKAAEDELRAMLAS